MGDGIDEEGRTGKKGEFRNKELNEEERGTKGTSRIRWVGVERRKMFGT